MLGQVVGDALLELGVSGADRVANANALRAAIAKACRALGVPVWSAHDLRHRRISLLHRQGRSWAEIAALVGQRKTVGHGRFSPKRS